ncbi:prepilin-type N-terminal cleavage/methylation domain-containing protein [Sporosarcina sp. Sa2YVA2]|uniref:Prepilin-type N-terminal cleavage/methylation domain-containing protein n=1 Tax=Sporosarcina quadrami TaxID=2762234 RepID=A0ABR8U4Q5_9BACL|nr:prepilin-type N-terminal cleavage/methylation domain-containing protein [Sporosarcina quadrami]MBD7983021.1 prepilin-type N-terminal cleavage/methylation domain-containing protein [Sporosarcina quadrami]
MLWKERGMTLVEVLVTLLLSSLIIVLISTTIMISMKYNIAESKKTQMQQEANYIITDIQRIHRQYSCYEIIENEVDEEWIIKDCINNKNISIYNSYPFAIKLSESGKIYTKRNVNDESESLYNAKYPLTVTVSLNSNPSLKVDIKSLIFRYEDS